MYATLRAPFATPNRYFIIIFLVSCALLAGFTYTLYQQSKDREQYNELTLHSYEVIRLSKHVLELTIDIETGQRGYLLTKSREFLQPYYAGLANIDPTLNLMRDMLHGNQTQLKNLEDLMNKSRKWRLYVMKQIRNFEMNEGALMTVGELRASKDLMDDVRLAVDVLISTERTKLDALITVANQKQEQYFITLFLGAVLAIGGLLVANFIIMGLVARSRKTNAKLQSVSETYELLLDTLNDGIYDYYPQSGRMHFSKSFSDMLGYREEFENNIDAFNRILHPSDQESFWETVERFCKRETSDFSLTFRLRHRDGKWRWILARGVGAWNKQGECTRLIGIHTDITEQKHREEELQQINEEMESFIYIASHDMRAPLVNLKGFAGEISTTLKEVEPLLSKAVASLPEKERESLKQAIEHDIPESITFIRSGVKRMDSLTNAILDLSRIGRRQIHLEPINTKALVQRCLDSLAYELGQRNIEVQLLDLPDVVSDPLALEQVFGNLLDNAVKYLDPQRSGVITISGRIRQSEVEFTIADNGRGIAPADHKKVFDIFRRASNSGDVRGAGMGMAYVKASLRKLGGIIWFDSALGKGTSFYFTIPALSAAHPSPVSEAA
jgi:PAS domain S-box-containing protein